MIEPQTRQPLDYYTPGLIRTALLKNLQGPAPHTLLQGQAELIIFDGQYLLHWLDERGGDQFKFLSQADVSAAFTEQEIASGWLPPGIVQWGKNARGTWIVLWIPAGRHTVILTGNAMPQEPVSVPMPALVFAGIGTTYYVWATKGETFEPSLPLYHVPLPNINTDGRICFGNNQPPSVASDTILSAWNLFISSPFNADLASGKSEKQKNNIQHQLCMVRKKQQYPISDLLPIKHYLDQGATTVATMVERQFLKGEG